MSSTPIHTGLSDSLNKENNGNPECYRSESKFFVMPVPSFSVNGGGLPVRSRTVEFFPTDISEAELLAPLMELKGRVTGQDAAIADPKAGRDQNCSTHLARSVEMHINDVNGFFEPDFFSSNSQLPDQDLLEYFAKLWNSVPDSSSTSTEHAQGYESRYHGYILKNGCTETTIYGLCNARDYLKGRSLIEYPHQASQESTAGPAVEKRVVYANPLPLEANSASGNSQNAYTPIVFYSEDAHYSVVQAVRLLELTTFYQEGRARYPGQCPITRNGEWPEEVPSHDYDKNDPLSGTIRVDDLTTLVRFFAGRGYPIVIVLNLGTTWKGAYDDVPAVDKMLKELEEEFPWLWDRTITYASDVENYTIQRRGLWVHVDGTPGATFLPFIEMAWKKGLISRKGPVFDFRNQSVMSIGCSLQKWMSGPWPSEIYMVRAYYDLLPPEILEAVRSGDTALAEQNAEAPMFPDDASFIHWQDNMRKALEAEALAAYLEGELRRLEGELQRTFGTDVNLWIARSRLALTVRFRLVNPALSAKWELRTERLHVPVGPNLQQLRSYSHICVLNAISRQQITELMQDLRQAVAEDWHNAFPDWDGSLPNPGPQNPLASFQRIRASHRTVMPYQGEGRKNDEI